MGKANYYRGKVAIVTGASSGIGLETARILAHKGAVVVAVARREERLAALLEDLKLTSPESIYLCGDISDKAFAGTLVQQVVERCGRIDILINNAGIPMHRMIYKISVDEAEGVMRTNFLSCLWTSLAAIEHMLRDGGGVIVNVSSFGSKVPPTHESVYVASKCAMNGFTRGLWGDLQGSGIHAMLVHPGPIATEIWSKLDEPGAYNGPVYPADLVARQLLAAMERREFEVVLPRWNFKLWVARCLYAIAPSIVRAGVARMDPVNQDELRVIKRRLKEAE